MHPTEFDYPPATQGSVKNALKPKKNNNRFVVKKNARRALQSVAKQVASTRPDLKVRAGCHISHCFLWPVSLELELCRNLLIDASRFPLMLISQTALQH